MFILPPFGLNIATYIQIIYYLLYNAPFFLSVSGAISSLVKLKTLHCTKKTRKKACLVGTCTLYNNHIIGRHTNVNHSGFWIYLYLIVVQDVKEIKY